MKRTKIICTLGPASSDEKVMEGMLKNGMNLARLNFSHGTHEEHKKMIEKFRRVRDSLGLPAAIMLDTKGPEIRLKQFENKTVTLIAGDEFTLTTNDVIGNNKIVSITYKDLPSQIAEGQRMLIDDGRVLLKVKKTTKTDIICSVEVGGPVSNNKGMNIPNTKLNLVYLSENDKKDLLFGIENDIDFIAASFVRNKNDIIDLRKFLDYHGGHNIKIIAKIENMSGVENFDEILYHSNGIMVARGDMGVEIEFEKLPGLQKKFIKKCYQAGKMVITATQMLESMIHSTTPTRAEITDVANAVFEGTSAIMLSGETAMGDHPVLVVEIMTKIARQAEKDAFEMNYFEGIKYDIDKLDMTNAICDAACTTARDVNAKAIIAVTKTGYAARRVSKFRPREMIIAATPEIKTFHQLSLSWGVYPVLSLYQNDSDLLLKHAVDCSKSADLINEGDTVVITAGIPLNVAGTTNILKVEVVTKSVS